MQGAQTILRAHRSGVIYLRALLEKAKPRWPAMVICQKGLVEHLCEFGFWDYLFAL